MLDKNINYIFILAIITIGIFFIPYLSILTIVGFIIFYISIIDVVKYEKYTAFYVFFILFTLSAISISTKNLNPIMNDKVTYWDFMVDNYSVGFLEWLIKYRGNDIASYGLFKLASEIFGINDAAFAFYLFVSLLFLYAGSKNLIGKFSLLALFCFMPQYNYEGLFGNLLRQSLALSLFVYAISFRSPFKKYFYIFISSLSHFSIFIYIPFVTLEKRLKGGLIKYVIFYVSSYILGNHVFPLIMSYLSTFGSFFSERQAAYEDSIFGNDINRKLFVTIILISIVEIMNFFKPLLIGNDEHINLNKLRVYVLITSCVFFLTMSYQEVANRYSFNIMVFVLLYLCMFISLIKFNSIKISSLLLVILISCGMYYYINIVGVQFFYYGDLVSLNTDSLISIWKKILG